MTVLAVPRQGWQYKLLYSQVQAEPLSKRMRVSIKRSATHGEAAAAKQMDVGMLVYALDWVGEHSAALLSSGMLTALALGRVACMGSVA